MMAVIKNFVVGKSAGSYQNTETYAFVESLAEADIVLNHAAPAQHSAETKAALEAGKHVYCAAPLAASFSEANELTRLAAEKGLLLCAGSCDFLNTSLQGVRRLLEEDVVGKPFAAAVKLFRRTDADLTAEACLFITVLMSLFGAVKSVSGMSAGAHYAGVLRFAGGEIATVTFSCNTCSMPNTNCLEVYAARGNLALDEPGGTIRIKIGDEDTLPADGSWGGGKWLPIDSPYSDPRQDDSICLGLADMIAALRDNRAPRANAQQALHALEVLSAIERSQAEGREIAITTPYERGPVLSLVETF